MDRREAERLLERLDIMIENRFLQPQRLEDAVRREQIRFELADAEGRPFP